MTSFAAMDEERRRLLDRVEAIIWMPHEQQVGMLRRFATDHPETFDALLDQMRNGKAGHDG